MKNLIRLLFATLLSSAFSFGVDAIKVNVKLDKAAPLEMKRVSPPNGSGYFPVTSARSNKVKPNPSGWHFVGFPLYAEAEGRGKEEPDFIRELTVDVYLLMTRETSDRPMILKKTLTYVDIPIFEGKGIFNVGVFLNPAAVSWLTTAKNKEQEAGTGDMKRRLAGYAVVARFDGKICNFVDSRSESDIVFANEYKSKFSGKKWWESTKLAGPSEVQLLGINETPFAAHYAPTFPMMKPLYAVAADAKASSSPDDSADSYESVEDTSASTSSSTRSSRSSSSRSRSSRTADSADSAE